jgi:N-methylhydantoinase B
MEGGGEGTLNHIVISGEGKMPLRVRKISAHRLDRGDVVSIRTGAGGGWGDPLERDPAQVLADVRAGYVSRETARDIYGVILTEDKLEFDAASTAALRASLRAK